MGSDILENIMVDESGNHHEMVQVHELGFVKLLDVMGDDQEVENAARISYGEGTRKVNQTRNLIRYLMRHKHTSPFEMCEVKFHLKLPIFIVAFLKPEVFNIFIDVSIISLSSLFSSLLENISIPI